MSQFTIQEMKNRIMRAAQAYYNGKIEKAWFLYLLTTSEESGCSRYHDEAVDELNRLVEERDGFVRNVENMDDTNISSLDAKIFAVVS